MFKIIPIAELQCGMFVNSVTKQDGRFKVKTKGLVRTEKIIQQLKDKGILEVEIDTDKSSLPKETEVTEESTKQHEETPIDKALPAAVDLYADAKNMQQKLLDDVKNGNEINLEPVKDLSASLIDSIFKNQDALLCVSRIREKDSYLLEHSLNVSILMTIFAKYLGMDQEIIEQVSLGGLLHDIGKILTPDEVLHKPGKLTAEEYGIMQQHVNYGTEILKQTPGISDLTYEVVANHHERLDGQGYPSKLSGDNLSIYSRMVAIVDTFDAITAERCYKKGLGANKAFGIMMKESGSYDGNLVQQFIRAVGIHPVGTVVKLSSQRLGIVTRSNKELPLRPVVTIFYHANHSRYLPIERVDLSKGKGKEEEIESSVKPDEFKINLNKFFKEVFVTSFNS